MADTIAELASLLKLGPDAPLQPPRFAKVVSVAGDTVTVTLGGSNADAVRCCACAADDIVLLETMPSGQLAAVATKGASGGDYKPNVVHYLSAITGGTGWLRLCTISTGSATNHGDAPIRITYAHRAYTNAYIPDYCTVTINFSSNADPSVTVFRADGLHEQEARLVKDDTGIWSLWIRKWQNWDTLLVYECIIPNPPMTTVTITWSEPTPANYSASTPSGLVNQAIQNGGGQSYYATCTTAAATAAKSASCGGFLLTKGAHIACMFTLGNTAASPTLNVNNTGAKTIYYRGAAVSGTNPLTWSANHVVSFVYAGAVWVVVGMDSWD